MTVDEFNKKIGGGSISVKPDGTVISSFYTHDTPDIAVDDDSPFGTHIREAIEIFRQWRCERKVKYGHAETADKAIVSMESKGSVGMSRYQCETCGAWHIGHKLTGTDTLEGK